MFLDDEPIQVKKDDILSRGKFVHHLGDALLGREKEESLVIALYGEWGSGKSSIINLVLEHIKTDSCENKPAIIRFNPWQFSETGNLVKYFFNEIASKLSKKKSIGRGVKNLFRDYGDILGDIPKIGFLFKLLHKRTQDKSLSDIKDKIKTELMDKKKTILIVIDDIDRLNQSEIKQIFRLIKINADFPNTIYLLAFDRKVVEENLDEQKGIAGKDYMDKIVQVNFDIPAISQTILSNLLRDKIDRILDGLPVEKYFRNDDLYWPSVYDSGFKDFFKNIRDIKRFANSLELNLAHMHQHNIMEVNPIDFIAIEAIRIFAPDFYLFMKSNLMLFVDSTTDGVNTFSKHASDLRKEKIEKVLDEPSSENLKDSILLLVKRLFPQIDDVYRGSSSSKYDWRFWRRELRICVPRHFNMYFNFIPGGDDEELSQYEIEAVILPNANSSEKFEGILMRYIKEKRIKKAITRILDLASDQSRSLLRPNAMHVILALLNVFDDLPEEKYNIYDPHQTDSDLLRIIHELLLSKKNKDERLETLKQAILSSRGLDGSIRLTKRLSSETQEDGIIPKNGVEELQRLCVDKIKRIGADNLLKRKGDFSIFYHWKEWDREGTWKAFIEQVKTSDNTLLEFMSSLLNEPNNTISSDGYRFQWNNFAACLDLKETKTRLESIKEQNSDLYEKYKRLMDVYLDDFDKIDQSLVNR